MGQNLSLCFIEEPYQQILSKDQECKICLDSLQEKDTKILECGHIFCRKCIKAWYQRSTTCPTCRHQEVVDQILC